MSNIPPIFPNTQSITVVATTPSIPILPHSDSTLSTIRTLSPSTSQTGIAQLSVSPTNSQLFGVGSPPNDSVPLFPSHTTLSDLPNDITHLIICYLDLKSFLLMRLTCRLYHVLAENEWERFYRSVWQVPHRLVIWSDMQMRYVTSRLSGGNANRSGLSVGNDDGTRTSLAPNSIMEYNNPWKDLFIERFRIIHCKVSVGKKSKLGIFSPRQMSSEDFVERGYHYVYRNEYTKAIQAFEKAISLSKEKGCARALEGLAKICWQRDLPQYVIVYAEEALNSNPVNPGELFFIRGKALLKLSRLREALPDLTRAAEFLSLSPVNYHLFLNISEVYYERMMCHIELGNFDMAFSDAEKIVSSDRCFQDDCFYKAAKVLYEKQQYDEAERFMNSQYVKKNTDYYLLFLQIHSSNGKFKEALNCFRLYEAVEEKKKTNSFNYSPTMINKEVLIDIGIVLLMNDCIDEAVEKFSQGALMRSNPTSSVEETIRRRSSLSFVISPNKAIDEEASRKAKFQVGEAAKRQLQEYSQYFGSNCSTGCIDIHMAWSFYYFLLAMFYYCRNTVTISLKARHSSTVSTISSSQLLSLLEEANYNEETGSSARLIMLVKSQRNYIYQNHKSMAKFINEALENDLKHSITNLTRSITLNPTLCEGFYYRSLLKCFIQIDNPLASICSSPLFGSTLTQDGIVCFLIEKFKKRKVPQKEQLGFKQQHKRMHKNISEKINVVTVMREALNDCENAFTLITMELRIGGFDFEHEEQLEELDLKLDSDLMTLNLTNKSQRHNELMIDILILRSFLFYCFGKTEEASQSVKLAIYLCEELTKVCVSQPLENSSLVIISDTEKRNFACQGMLALIDDYVTLKDIRGEQTLRNDSVQRNVHHLIMNHLVETDQHSVITKDLDYLLIIIHSQLLQKDPEIQDRNATFDLR